MTVLWILGGIGYVGAIAAMMKSMAASGLPDRAEFDRAVHGWRAAEGLSATPQNIPTPVSASMAPSLSPERTAIAA